MAQKNLIFKYLKDKNILNKKNNNFDNASKVILNESVIKKIDLKSISGECIYKLATGLYYVYEDMNVVAFADELQKHNNINAVGVLDYDNKVKGIIIRNDFFKMLGKPFGRDIYKNKRINGIAEPCVCFFNEESIINVSEKLKSQLKEIENNYYICVDKSGAFSGIFSTKSILIYLSEITQKDLELAERLQKRIVNDDEYIDKKGFELAGVSKMAKEVGGDFYTVNETGNNKWIFSIFDISGKGISASLLTSLLGGMFNTFDFNKGLIHFASIVNRYIFNTFNLEKYATGIMIDYNDSNKEMSLYDAGHSFVYLFRNNKLLKLKTNPNLPLGVSGTITPLLSRLRVSLDDMIFLFTDGLIEQKNSLGKSYSIKRIEDILIKNQKNNLEVIKNIILEDINGFKNGQYQQDDITFILIKIK